MWSILKSPLILGNDVTNMVSILNFDFHEFTCRQECCSDERNDIDYYEQGHHRRQPGTLHLYNTRGSVLIAVVGRERCASEPHVETDRERRWRSIAVGRQLNQQVRTAFPSSHRELPLSFGFKIVRSCLRC